MLRIDSIGTHDYQRISLCRRGYTMTFSAQNKIIFIHNPKLAFILPVRCNYSMYAVLRVMCQLLVCVFLMVFGYCPFCIT